VFTVNKQKVSERAYRTSDLLLRALARGIRNMAWADERHGAAGIIPLFFIRLLSKHPLSLSLSRTANRKAARHSTTPSLNITASSLPSASLFLFHSYRARPTEFECTTLLLIETRCLWEVIE